MDPITWRQLYRFIVNMTDEERALPALFKFKGSDIYHPINDLPPIETFPWVELHPDPYSP